MASVDAQHVALPLPLPPLLRRVPSLSTLSVRAVGPEEKRLVTSMLSTSRWRHSHLDWQDPVDLLGQQPYLVAERDATYVGLMACPEGPEGVAWVRVLGLALGVDPDEVWQDLWEEAARRLLDSGIRHAACLLSGPWQRPLLSGSGFHETNAVVFFERSTRRIPPPGRSQVSFRRFEPSDLASVGAVDHAAFRPLWRVSPGTLEIAYRTAADAGVAAVDGRVVGYQLTTISPLGAHLARLAVDPAWQNRGIGSALVVRLLQRLVEQGVTRVTLNTQADNGKSQELYRRLGFRETGERLPVFEVQW